LSYKEVIFHYTDYTVDCPLPFS